MKKFWIVYGQKNDGVFQRYESYNDAECDAKRKAAMNRDSEFIILEAVASTKQPVPDIDIVKF